MYFSSKLAAGRVLAAFAILLWGFGGLAPQARGQQKGCPVQQVTQDTCPIVDPHAQHEAEEDRERALEREQKESDHAQHEADEDRERAIKEADHAKHEAEEARERELKDAEHARHEAAEDCARAQKKYDHARHEAEEAQQKASARLAKAEALAPNLCRVSEPVAEKPLPVPEVMRSKPEPEPEPEPIPEPVVEPATEPTPAPVEEVPPTKPLPKTAGELNLVGLIGLVSMTGYMTAFFRRK